MRGAIRSRLVFLIALLAMLLISVPGFTGEHPWDSDGKGNSSNSGGSSGGLDDPSRGSTAIASAACPLGSGNSDTRWSSRSTTSLMFRVSYYVAERLFFRQYDSGTKVRQVAHNADR